MNFLESGIKRWVCPSDRELTLRAKLQTGWSSRTNTDAALEINENEQALIAQVLERASRVEAAEHERVRKLNERLEKIKRQACGNGKKSCILCNDQLKFFSKFYTCKDCRNAVCNKCCIDTYELNTGEDIWLCKICSESREVAKKTNVWTQLCS
jgi:hypothetical protein